MSRKKKENLKNPNLSPWLRQLPLPESVAQRFVHLLTARKSQAIKHLPDSESFISRLFNRCAVLHLTIHRGQLPLEHVVPILYTFEYRPSINWTIFLDKHLTSNQDPNVLISMLYKILLQELISREKGLRPFWTPAYKELSEQLLSHTGTVLQDLPLTSSNQLWNEQVEKYLSLTIIRTEHVMKENLPKTYCPSSTSFLVDKWENEDTREKNHHAARKVRLYPTLEQKNKWMEWIHTSRYLYNKTLEKVISKQLKLNHYEIRNALVSTRTRKLGENYQQFESCLQVLKSIGLSQELEKVFYDCMIACPLVANPEVQDWESRTPKSIREQAAMEFCQAYKTNLDMFKKGQRKYFSMGFRKKHTCQTFGFDETLWRIKNGKIELATSYFSSPELNMDKKTILKLYNNDLLCKSGKIQKEDDQWWLILTEKRPIIPKQPKVKKACGIDIGVRSLMTIYDEHGVTTILHRREFINGLRSRINMLRNLRRPCRMRQSTLRKYESKIKNVMKETHYLVANYLVQEYDVIGLGDIHTNLRLVWKCRRHFHSLALWASHDILKKSKCRSKTKQELSDLSLYKLKVRLYQKAKEQSKMVLMVPEPYTSKTCTYCGKINQIGSSKQHSCPTCEKTFDRDEGSARNMYMKMILSDDIFVPKLA